MTSITVLRKRLLVLSDADGTLSATLLLRSFLYMYVSHCLLLATHRYMVAEDDKQATFTGADQRAGVFVLPYAVAGIFGRGRPKPTKDNRVAERAADAAGPKVVGGRKGISKSSRARTGKTKATASAGDGGDGRAVFGGKDHDDDEELPSGFKFDWDAYRAAFGETPMEDAVTIMFAEYAELYARIAGWTTSAAPAAMSLNEGDAIQKQASNFVINIMSPILGFVHTSKVHKLLAHTLDSIRFHGNLRHGNTSTNEAAHKTDKSFYRRTNMAIETFTGQLVRQAQGAREVRRRNDAADAHSLQTCPLVPPLRPRLSARAPTGVSGMSAAADEELTWSAVAPGGDDRGAADTAGAAGARGAAVHRGGEGRASAAAAAVGARGAAANPSDDGAPADAAGLAGAREAAAHLDRDRGAAAAAGATGARGAAAHASGDRGAAAAEGATATHGAAARPRPGGDGGAAAADAAAGGPRRRTATYLTRRSIGTLGQRPGLADIGALFKLPSESMVPVLSTVQFTAEFECGTKSNQLLRASPHFRDERPWYDAILFSCQEPADCAGVAARRPDGGGLQCSGQEKLYVGEVRAASPTRAPHPT